MSEQDLRRIIKYLVSKLKPGKTLLFEDVVDHPKFDTTGWTTQLVKQIIDNELKSIIKCLRKDDKFEDSDIESSGIESDSEDSGSEDSGHGSESSVESVISPKSGRSSSSSSRSSKRSSSPRSSKSSLESIGSETDYETEDYSEYKLVLSKYGQGYLLKGITRPIKEDIKELGGYWNRILGGWVFSPKRVSEVLKVLNPKKDF
jgi:hypothetical protein